MGTRQQPQSQDPGVDFGVSFSTCQQGESSGEGITILYCSNDMGENSGGKIIMRVEGEILVLDHEN